MGSLAPTGADTPRFSPNPLPNHTAESSSVSSEMNLSDSPLEPSAVESDFWVPDHAERVIENNLLQLREKIDQIQQKFEKNPELPTQFLLVSGADKTTKERFLSEKISGARATVNEEFILLRIMPGFAHESTACQFGIWFVIAMQAAGIPPSRLWWIGTGSSRQEGQFCSKEPDYSILPTITDPASRPTQSSWPSFVLEVGHSESLAMLRNDAQWWWNNSNYETKLILLVDIRTSPTRCANIELWEEVERQPGRPMTRSLANLQNSEAELRCTQSFTIDASGADEGISLKTSLLLRIPSNNSQLYQPFVTITPHMWDEICRLT